MSLADPQVQQCRKNKILPNGKLLHDHANLFFHARNPMLYKRIDPKQHAGKPGLLDDICVCKVSPQVMKENEVWVTDFNAASSGVCYYPVDEGIMRLDYALVFAKSWTALDINEQSRRKKIKSAEVLIHKKVPPHLILGVYVGSQSAFDSVTKILTETQKNVSVALNKDLFFQ